MAKTKTTPGPKPRHTNRRDYHIRLPRELADMLDQSSKEIGVSAYVESVLIAHFEKLMAEGWESLVREMNQ